MRGAVAALLLLLAAPAWAQTQPQPPAAPAPASPGAPPGPAPAAWIPKGGALLQALDKVNARVLPIQVRVGQSAKYGTLTIALRACVVRPPDQTPDSAAYLDITDNHPDAPDFHGWMIASAPSVSMLEHPIYDVRLTGCLP